MIFWLVLPLASVSSSSEKAKNDCVLCGLVRFCDGVERMAAAETETLRGLRMSRDLSPDK